MKMKYELDQVIYYLRNNKIHAAPVLSRKHVDNLMQEAACTEQQKVFFTRFGLSGTWYSTCHGAVNEADAFASKEELLASL